MPRMSKKRKEEWGPFFPSTSATVSPIIPFCRKCRRSCKQSFRAIIIECPPFRSKRAKP